MAKPTKHYGRWRIRWLDEDGTRRSEVFDDHKTAVAALRAREHEVAEVRAGVRPRTPPKKHFTDLAEYWAKNRAPLKRSEKDDLSILKQLRAAFGSMALDDIGGWVEGVDQYVLARGHLSKKTLANHLTLLNSLLRLGVELGWMLKCCLSRCSTARAPRSIVTAPGGSPGLRDRLGNERASGQSETPEPHAARASTPASWM